MTEQPKNEDIQQYVAEEFCDPLHDCDLVMQGGTASGVVYPPAILKIATRYRLRCVGGTSAGAIAAAAAAAAEYGRESGGYMKLQEIQKQLNNGQFVRALFQPSRKTRPLMETALELVKYTNGKDDGGTHKPPGRAKRTLDIIARLTKALLLHTTLMFAAGAIVGVGLLFLLAWLAGGALSIPLLLLSLVVAWLGGLAGGIAHLAWILLKHLPWNYYGMCTGSKQPNEKQSRDVLTDWLSGCINSLAGLSARMGELPLTFEHLSKKRLPDPDKPSTPGADVGITFKLVTTNLSQGQPYIFPLPKKADMFVFNLDDMKHFFPEHVWDYMRDWSNKYIRENQDVPALPEGFHFLPTGEALPIIVATRLSLSFPILLSAIRLYTIKGEAWERCRNETTKSTIEPGELQENWFSDGGISSNFPIHMFDAWLPGRPTFGIKLTSEPEELSAPSGVSAGRRVSSGADVQETKKVSVYLPLAREPLPPAWTALKSLPKFLFAMFDTARNYRDNMQSMLPSYRERVAQVRLAENEGGLNLEMPDEIIKSMMRKGQEAGRKLLEFGRNGFEEHKWVRLRVLMAQLETRLGELKLRYPSSDSYKQLLTAQLDVLNDEAKRFYSYENQEWCNEAERRFDALLDFMRVLEQAEQGWRNRPRGAEVLALAGAASSSSYEPANLGDDALLAGPDPLGEPGSGAGERTDVLDPLGFFNNTNVPTPPSVLRVTPEV